MSYSGDSSSTIPDDFKKHYQETLLEEAEELFEWKKFAEKKEIGPNEGLSTDIFGYRELALLTAALTEGDDATETNITGFNVTATVEEWGEFSKCTWQVKTQGRDKGLEGYSKVHGRLMGRQYDLLLMIAQAITGGFPVRIDNDSNYIITGTATGGDTSSVLGPAAVTTNLVGGRIIMTGKQSTNTTFCRPVSAHSGTDATVCGDTVIGSRTPGVFEASIDDTDVYRGVVPTGIAAADVLSSDGIKLALYWLRTNGAPMFKGKMYKAAIGINAEHDLKKDSEFVDFNKYRDYSAVKDGIIGRYWNCDFVPVSQWYRQGTGDYTYDAAGAVHITSFFGRHSLAVIDLKAHNVELRIMSPDDLGQPIKRYWTFGFHFVMVGLPHNPMFSVNLFHGASAV